MSIFTHIAAGLLQNASLTGQNIGDNTISAPRNNICNEGWVHMFKSLPSNTSLRNLNVIHSKLETKVTVTLAEMLSCNKSLTELNLKGISPRLDSDR